MSEHIEIEIRGLHKRFDGNHVLRGLDLDIPAQRTTVIMGPSGCGKSVLLKHLVGLLEPDAGRIVVGGRDMTAASEEERKQIMARFAIVFQSGALFNSLTVGENVAIGLREQRRFTNEHIERVVHEKLALVGLEGKQSLMPAEISGGMMKRVALARALAMEPEIILFDEPTTGLDPLMSDNVDELILDANRQLSITSIVVTHDMVSAFRVADHIAMLHEGKIVEFGTPDTVHHSHDPVVRRFLDGHRLDPAFVERPV